MECNCVFVKFKACKRSRWNKACALDFSADKVAAYRMFKIVDNIAIFADTAVIKYDNRLFN